MTKLLLSIAFLIIFSFASAQSPQTCVKTINDLGNDVTICNSDNLKPVSPCGIVTFIVSNYLPVPSGYATVGKFEWYVNGTLAKMTTDASDPIFDYTVESSSISVYCKVTYQKTDGTLSTPYTSTTFSPIVKVLDFPVNIIAETPLPNYGCSSNTVSFSLPETPCTSSGFICDGTYNVSGNYNITWQAPSGWVQTSLTNNGSNVSFTPDANSTGTLTATIHLPGCSYTETRTFAITRVAEPPSFTKSSFEGCNGSSVNVSINPTCGATNYTYTIVGNSGVTFTTNGSQTLTTPNTTVNVSVSGGTSLNSLRAKANYGGSISSTENTSSLSVFSGAPTMGGTYNSNGVTHPMKYYYGNASDYNSVCNYARDTVNMVVNNATSVTWSQLSANPGPVTYSQFGNNLTFYLWSINQTSVFEVDATNGCGTLSYQFGFKSIDCSSGGGGGCPSYSISPNPTQGTIQITPNIPAPCDPPPTLSTANTSVNSLSTSTSKRSISKVDVYDNFGNLKKSIVENNAKQVTVDLSGFKPGIYVVVIYDGSYTEKQQIIIR